METALASAISAGTLLVVFVGTIELHRKRRGRRCGTPLSATYINEVTALFHGTKRAELDYRESISLLREEHQQGAPPKMGIDLERGTARLPGVRRRSALPLTRRPATPEPPA